MKVAHNVSSVHEAVHGAGQGAFVSVAVATRVPPRPSDSGLCHGPQHGFPWHGTDPHRVHPFRDTTLQRRQPVTVGKAQLLHKSVPEARCRRLLYRAKLPTGPCVEQCASVAVLILMQAARGQASPLHPQLLELDAVPVQVGRCAHVWKLRVSQEGALPSGGEHAKERG